MKIVFCGPQNSGKSVFLANLIKKLPANSFQIIQAQMNGGGLFKYNPNQTQVQMVTVTSDYNETAIRNWALDIKHTPNNLITLVDIDGILSDDKIPIFKACEYFIIVSNDKKSTADWQKFGGQCNIGCLAVIHSSLEEKADYIISDSTPLEGCCHQLIRGRSPADSVVIDKLAGLLVDSVKYKDPDFKDKNIINIMKPAEEIGLTETQHYLDTSWKTLHFSEKNSPDIYNYFLQEAKQHKTYCNLYGIRPNWASAIAVSALLEGGTSRVGIYDRTNNDFITIKSMPFANITESCGIPFGIRQSANEVFLDVQTKNQVILQETYQNLVLPNLPSDKILYISGKMPLWLSDSIAISYRNPIKYILQPGNGFICISNPDTQRLGNIVTKPQEIDLLKYFDSVPKQVVPFMEEAGVRGTFVDYRDGHVYHWQKIGQQIWMIENLNYSDETQMGKAPNMDFASTQQYGLLYTQEEARAACPWLNGWVLPTIDDITELLNYVCQDAEERGCYNQCMQKLSELGFGNIKMAGANIQGKTQGFDNYTIFWTDTIIKKEGKEQNEQAWGFGVNANFGLTATFDTNNRYSVRCIKKVELTTAKRINKKRS